MRLLTAICVAAIAVAFCVPAFAETQNVKISGDINVWTLARHNFNLDKSVDAPGTANGGDTTAVFMQQVGLNVEADLTDNVSTYVRIINERDWDATNGLTVDLDEAYVTLKEMLYAPLTVRIGRQNLWFGKGFIIGNNSSAWDPIGHLTANEISTSTAFDAIRGTLDYDPWTLDMVYAKIDENAAAATDDVELSGVNLGYLFDKYEAEAEAYWFYEHDRGPEGDAAKNAAAGKRGSSTIHTIGLRGSFVPYEDVNVWLEGALQAGEYVSNLEAVDMDREAFALDVGGDYTFADVRWTPLLGLEYIFYSGAEPERNQEDWEGWDMMYRGKFDSQIREYQNLLYNTAFDNANSRTRNNGGTNQHQFIIRSGIDPMEDIRFDANLNFFWLQQDLDDTVNTALPAGATGEEFLGTELDGVITYDYTEDVKFQLAGAIFWAGEVYPGGQDDDATQIAARCAVEF